MSDISNLIGKLEFIRDYECKTKPEVGAMDEAITKLSAEPEREIYVKMPDAEFEKWLHDNGICNPNIHESIPCSCVPLLIDSAINELPSAEPERKQGKWIYNSPVTMKCNQCGLVIKDWEWHRFKYCPNCGVRMDGEQQDLYEKAEFDDDKKLLRDIKNGKGLPKI